MKQAPLAGRAQAALLLAALCLGGTAAAQGVADVPPRACTAAPCRLAPSPALADAVVFRGALISHADGGIASSMTYQLPAGAGIGGLFAAIATHGALVEGTRQSAMTKAQQAADAVLMPYKEVLDALSNRALLAQALDALNRAGNATLLPEGDGAAAAAGATGTGSTWVIESAPVFTLTQDQTALVLDNAIVLRSPWPGNTGYKTVVRVVSEPLADQEPQAAWLADQGKKLKAESVQMLAHSVHMLLKSLAAAPASDAPTAQQTFRYLEGKVRKAERAELVERGCARAVVKTLRGWMMSIPQPAESPDACKDAPRYVL